MSAKGTTWKNHKYLKRNNGRYYYDSFETKIKETSSSFETKIKETSSSFETKIKETSSSFEKIALSIGNIKISVPNVKIDKEQIKEGLKLFDKYISSIGKQFNKALVQEMERTKIKISNIRERKTLY